MGIKERPGGLGNAGYISGRDVEREQARLAREAATTGGVRRNALCKCGCGFPTGQRNGYVRLHTPKAVGTTVKLRKDGHGGYLWTASTGGQWSVFSWSWPTEKPFGMGPREWAAMRAPEWFESGLTWHLSGPDGHRVKSFKALWEVKQYLSQL